MMLRYSIGHKLVLVIIKRKVCHDEVVDHMLTVRYLLIKWCLLLIA